jgi:arachidonate 15-lipoxygenase
MKTLALPQDDPSPQARADALEDQQNKVKYDHETYSPLAMSASVPPEDVFPAPWWKVNLGVMADLLENTATVAKVRKPGREIDSEVWTLVEEAREFSEGIPEAMILLGKVTAAMGPLAQSGRPTSFADYGTLFQSIPAPPAVYRSLDDYWFTQNFLSGANPMMLNALIKLDPARMALTDGLVQAVLGTDFTVEAALAKKRLFVADYGALAGADTGKYLDGTQKYLPAPIAFFGVNDAGELLPIAIQIDGKPDSVLTIPSDGIGWLGARTAVMTADANMSAVYFHHAKTHMVVEPIIVATRRQLADTHPIRALLEPHFVGTLAINRTGQQTVFSPGGTISVVGAATREVFRAVSIKAVRTQNVRDLAFPESLKARGVDDPDVLPGFAFRDDALLLWNAIEGWAHDYVDAWYAEDEDIRKDSELAAWFAELGSENGGRLTGLGELKTRADLVEMAAITIFTASAQHWALNGPLAALMTFAPNYPLAMWGEPGLTSSVEEWLAMLPPLEMAQLQLTAAYGMGKTQYTVLAEFPEDQFTDERVQAPLEAYRSRLAESEALILERNRTRKAPYPYLVPSQLPASINI